MLIKDSNNGAELVTLYYEWVASDRARKIPF
jgi:hypothetical protein